MWTLDRHGLSIHVLLFQERLLALSRRARRALERELQASNQQHSSNTAAPNRSSSAHPQAGPSRDPSRPQEGSRGVDRRAMRGEGASARQKELSDRALKILEELSTFGRQVRVSFDRDLFMQLKSCLRL